MSKKKKRNQSLLSENPVHHKTSFSLLFVLLSALFLLFYIINVFNDRYFLQIKNIGLIFSYISVFSIALILLYHQIQNKSLSTKKWYILLSFLAAAVIIIYIQAFYPYLEMNGDNAGYLIRAKSLLLGKGFRDIFKPGEPYNLSLYNVGFSLLLIPFILLGNYNLIIIKLLPFFSTLGSFFLFYIILRQYFSKEKSLLFVILVIMNEEIIHFSTLILTENVFIFFILLTIFFLIKYSQKSKTFNLYFYLTVLTLFTTFLVRFAGLVFLGMAPLYLLWKKQYKKFIAFSVGIIILFGIFTGIKMSIKQHYNSPTATQQSETKLDSVDSSNLVIYIFNRLTKNKQMIQNIGTSVLVLPQKILTYSYKSKYGKEKIYNILLFLLLAIGIFYDIKLLKSPFSSFLSGFILSIIVFYDIPDKIVISRYFVPMIPFAYFFILYGFEQISLSLSKNNNLTKYVFFILYGILFIITLKTANIGLTISKNGIPYSYKNFISIAEWTKNNIPKNEIIAARKDNIFYWFSNHKSTLYYNQMDGKFSRYSSFSSELEKETLAMYKNLKLHYIVFDTFSGDSFGKLLPIMQHYPKRFQTQLVYISNNKLIKLPRQWWMNNNIVAQLQKANAAILLKYSPTAAN